MSKYYKSVSDRFSQFPKGEVYEHIWTEKMPDGDSGLRDKNGADSRIQSTLLHDPRYFLEAPFSGDSQAGDELDTIWEAVKYKPEIYHRTHFKHDVAAYAERLATKRAIVELQLMKAVFNDAHIDRAVDGRIKELEATLTKEEQ